MEVIPAGSRDSIQSNNETGSGRGDNDPIRPDINANEIHSESDASTIPSQSRKIGGIDFLQESRKTGNNRKVDDIAKRLKLEIAYNHVSSFPFQLYLGIDSENLSSSRKRRRYATVIGVLGQDRNGFARNKVFQKQWIEADDTSMSARIYYEACSVGKALKELNTHDELKQILASSKSGFELHIDAYTTHSPDYADKSSSQAYKRIEKLVNKRKKFPFLERVVFKPDAIFATGVCDHACRNKF